MGEYPTKQQFAAIKSGYHSDPSQSLSLRADAYTDAQWYRSTCRRSSAKTWQWVCHAEKLREPGAFVPIDIAGKPIVVVGIAKAVCEPSTMSASTARTSSRGRGQGDADHVSVPRVDLQAERPAGCARRTRSISRISIRRPSALEPVQVEEFCGFIYVNLDAKSESLGKLSGDLENGDSALGA